MARSDSPSHRITFCEANFKPMGCDVAATARRPADRIAFVPFRDLDRPATDLTETFHDAGPADMPAMLRLDQGIGFRGPIRIEHVPALATEEDLRHGYAHLGRPFAIGAMAGILDRAPIPYT